MTNQLVYYPSFEPTDEDWLKFALLYFEKVTPIIPESADVHLSEDFRYVQESTDLLEPLRPGSEEGYNASTDALDQVERVLRNPERFEHIFGTRDIVSEWRRPARQTVELFGEKYGNYWGHFCVENNLARQSEHGITMARSLADVYMTVLAHAISDARGISPITDDKRMDDYGLFLGKDLPSEDSRETVRFAQGVLSLTAPRLQAVSLERVIRFRNKQSVADHRREFNRALDFVHDSRRIQA